MVGGTPSTHHHPDLAGGTPGTPPTTIQTWDGVTLHHLDMGWVPPHPDLGWGTPPPTDLGQGTPPPPES